MWTADPVVTDLFTSRLISREQLSDAFSKDLYGDQLEYNKYSNKLKVCKMKRSIVMKINSKSLGITTSYKSTCGWIVTAVEKDGLGDQHGLLINDRITDFLVSTSSNGTLRWNPAKEFNINHINNTTSYTLKITRGGKAHPILHGDKDTHTPNWLNLCLQETDERKKILADMV